MICKVPTVTKHDIASVRNKEGMVDQSIFLIIKRYKTKHLFWCRHVIFNMLEPCCIVLRYGTNQFYPCPSCYYAYRGLPNGGRATLAIWGNQPQDSTKKRWYNRKDHANEIQRSKNILCFTLKLNCLSDQLVVTVFWGGRIHDINIWIRFFCIERCYSWMRWYFVHAFILQRT